MSYLRISPSSVLFVIFLATSILSVQASPGANAAPKPPGAPPSAQSLPPQMPPFLSGLSLSDAQQDKVFLIHHQQAPMLHARRKAARNAREALRELGSAVNFDLDRARELARHLAEAEAEITLLNAQAMHQIMAVLSPEQRQQLAAIKHREPSEGMREPPPQPPHGRTERR